MNFTTSYQTGHDALEAHNGMQCSTYDVDNDEFSRSNCAERGGGYGGNWYNDCFDQNLNGIYKDYDGIDAMSWYGFDANKSAVVLCGR